MNIEQLIAEVSVASNVEHLLLAGLGALSAVVVWLWRVEYTQCQEDRKRLWEAIDKLTEKKE